ncbi:hypothetical protein JVT61DRAFT_4484 [Boletus reticuloceps]|uniref:Heterokaryon incompatibility domain-containing protein n=1 Tax=Boletus reticuloceps TaxID=495285 RepID=A0A8I2YMA8_9AGAM|nr:hypothetical protein JVT61DRAFT_4484 [Boletus reticuloceps]
MFHPRRNPSYTDYPDNDDPYYHPRPPPPPQQAPQSSSRRRPVQDPNYHHLYHRHRDDRATPSPAPNVAPHLSRRQSSTTTNGTSDYAYAHAFVAAAPLPGSIEATPPIPQPSLSERETLVRQRLQTTFETYVFNTLPTHLLRVTDMTLVTRNEMWETFKPRIESLSDSHLAKLLLEQDEEARKLGVSVIDQEVLAPFTEYVRSMISFAIFSHRWGNGEPLFHELPSKRLQVTRRSAPTGPGYQKLAKFCEKARTDYGCEYVWTDTCCINKESSTELEEAILSMGVWYSEAGICIVHLGDSLTLEDFMREPWFTRGWTLQELLLPRKIRFYGKNWSPICPVVAEGRREERAGKDIRDDQRVNDKDNESVIAAITKVTGIPEADLRNFVPSCARVFRKDEMGIAAHHISHRGHGILLLGLFDVAMPIAYGDGARAFYKLMSTIAEQCTEPDFFAWAGKPSQWSLALPSSPQCYGPQPTQSDLVRPLSALGDPSYELTKLGLHARLVLVPAYCELLESTDPNNARFLLTPALATAQEPIQIYLPLASVIQHGHGPSRTKNYHDHDPRERERDVQAGRGREHEYALGVVDYDVRSGPPGYAALHGGRAHLCLVLERERRGRGWVRVARPGALSVRFRENELLPVESVCLVHRAS